MSDEKAVKPISGRPALGRSRGRTVSGAYCRQPAPWTIAPGVISGQAAFIPTGVLQRKAEVLHFIGQWPEATAILQKIISRAPDDVRFRQTPLLAQLHLYGGDYGKAVDLLNEAKAHYQATGDRANLANVTGLIGNAMMQQGLYCEAMVHFREKLALSRSVGDRLAESHALGNIGGVHFYRKEYKSAIGHFRRQLAYAEEVGDPKKTAMCLGNIGATHCELGEYKTALRYLEKSLSINRRIGDLPQAMYDMGNIGTALKRQGRYREAAPYFHDYLELATRLGDLWSESYALAHLGDLMIFQGDHREGVRYYLQDLAVSRSLRNNEAVALALHNLGYLYVRIGDFVAAERAYREAMANAEERGDYFYLSEYSYSFADMLFERGRTEEASGICSRAASLAQDRGREDILWQCRILEARIAASSDRDRAVETLHRAADNANTGNIRAAATRSIFEITGREADRLKAVKAYEELHAQRPSHEHSRILEELRSRAV